MELKNRFMRLVYPTENCWFWIGAISKRGYGKFFLNGRLTEAHRAAHILFKGPLSSGLEVMHICDIKQCVRHDHLTQGTRKENNQDALSKGSYGGLEAAFRTHCRRGHPLSGENLIERVNGWRRCRACKNLSYERRAAWAKLTGEK